MCVCIHTLGYMHSPHYAQSSEFCSSSPAAVPPPPTYKWQQNQYGRLPDMIFEQRRLQLGGRYSLEGCVEGFVFPHEGYSDQAVPLLFCFRSKRKNSVKRLQFTTVLPTFLNSDLTWKFTGGGGFFGSILTTLDSTFGGGRKLFFPTWWKGEKTCCDTIRMSRLKDTLRCLQRWHANMRACTRTFMRWSTRASSCVLMDSLQYSLSPGLATNRIANSLWNINTAHLNESKTKELLDTQPGHERNTVVAVFLTLLPEKRSMQQELEDKRWWNLRETLRNV